MATIIYTANIGKNGPEQAVNFTTLFEDKEAEIRSVKPTLDQHKNKFYPIILQVKSGGIESNQRKIYLHIREKEQKHFMITSEQYQTYKSQIDVAEVVIFINDEVGAVNEIEELKEYLNIE